MLQNKELHSMYRSPNIVRVIKSRRLIWAGHVVRMEEGRSAFKILTGKRPLGRPSIWEDNIKMNLEKIGINAGNWVDSALDKNYWRALVNVAFNPILLEKSHVSISGGLKVDLNFLLNTSW